MEVNCEVNNLDMMVIIMALRALQDCGHLYAESIVEHAEMLERGFCDMVVNAHYGYISITNLKPRK